MGFLNSLNKLKRDRLSEVVGRSPRDWTLTDDEGVPLYFEFRVGTSACEAWVDHLGGACGANPPWDEGI